MWEDGIAAVRADLREWLRRSAEDPGDLAPFGFEVSFGLPHRRDQDDVLSREDPAALDCGIRLRGSIDLVEKSPGGTVRATDHKTGKVRVKKGEIVAGGKALQPVLYALAAEKIFPDATVESGRLYYCTAAGGFEDRIVPLDPAARESARVIAEVIGGALEEGFLPAAPGERECRWCDYAQLCGPWEEARTGRKPERRGEGLRRIRGLA